MIKIVERVDTHELLSLPKSHVSSSLKHTAVMCRSSLITRVDRASIFCLANHEPI